MTTTRPANIVWRSPSGAPVSCVEKIKVLNENYAELRQLVTDALDDALLMGCSEQQVREIFRALIDEVAPTCAQQEA